MITSNINGNLLDLKTLQDIRCAANATTPITLEQDKIYLVSIGNAYNMGCVFLVFTGGLGSKCKIKMLESNDYFTINSRGINSFDVVAGSATGYLFAINLT